MIFTYDFGIMQWIFFIALIVYSVFWISGSEPFRDPDKRFPKIESLDVLFLSEFGFIFFQLRNALIWILLFIILRIIT